MASFKSYKDYCGSKNLHVPPELEAFLDSKWVTQLNGLLYRPDVSGEQKNSLDTALELLNTAYMEPPRNLLPLLPVDDHSIACAVCADLGEENQDLGVVRWHLGEIDTKFQGGRLDETAFSYLQSMAQELGKRENDMKAFNLIAKQYFKAFVDKKNIRPKNWVERPIQLACQNVIIGLASLMYDSSFDGLRVPIYLTCELSHLATHEANRAMAALLLCDAFQNGGTMEIRFGKNKELPVPPSLRRYGRTVNLDLGVEDQFVISPKEARDLFLAVTPLPDELRERADKLFKRGILSPERLCYTMLSSTWEAIELDYIIGVSSRAGSILKGGESSKVRKNKLAELEVCRAAKMIGTLLQRLDNKDLAAHSENDVRMFTSGEKRVTWTVRENDGIVIFDLLPEGRLPWHPTDQDSLYIGNGEVLVVVPRSLPTPHDFKLINNLKEEFPSDIVKLLVPPDVKGAIPSETPYLEYPDRLAELDSQIEKKLLKLRTARS